MPSYKRIGWALFCFSLIYGALLLCWPVVSVGYCAFFRALASQAYGDNDARELSFEPLLRDGYLSDTRVVIVNRALMHADGAGPVRNLDFDTFCYAWKPSAMLVALICATPIATRRKYKALFLGLAIEHCIVLAGLGFCIWRESSEISLVQLTASEMQMAGDLENAVVVQLDFTVPFLTWLVVTFRREDLPGIRRKLYDSVRFPARSSTT